MNKLNIDHPQERTLIEYFKSMFENIGKSWNVETALDFFGNGQSNEGTDESKAIKRYYVKPFDSRFKEIYLNFDCNRNVESIVWFLDKENSHLITLKDLKSLFGEFKMSNVIYDETTELTFTPKMNDNIQYIRSSILEWVEKRTDGTLYFKENGKKIDIDDECKFSSLIFKIKTVPNQTYKQ